MVIDEYILEPLDKAGAVHPVDLVQEGLIPFASLRNPSDIVWARWRLQDGWSLEGDSVEAEWSFQYQGCPFSTFTEERDAAGRRHPYPLKLTRAWFEGNKKPLNAERIDKQTFRVSLTESFHNHFAEINIHYTLTFHHQRRRVTVQHTTTKRRL